jgi:hypothetical protein
LKAAPDVSKDHQDALIEQLQGEIAFLRESLQREQETARALVSQIAEAENRSKVLLAATATGRIAPLEGLGDTETNGKTDGVEQSPRRWWQVWR